MKKLLAIIAISIAALNSNAQTEAGKIILGGSFEYNSTKNEQQNSKSSGLLIGPNIGYFVSDNLAIGIGLGYQRTKYEQDLELIGGNPIYKSKNHTFYISPYIRHYTALSEQFKFFAQFSGNYYYSKSETDVNSPGTPISQTSNSYSVQLSPGLAFFPSKRFGIEFALNGIYYTYNKSKDLQIARESTSKDFNIRLNATSPRIGLQYYF